MATYGGARGLAQAFLRSAAEAGMKVSEAIRALEESPYTTYRRQDMLKDYRQFLGIPDRADRIKYVPSHYRPGVDLYTEVTGYQRSIFRYQNEVRLYKRSTGEHFTIHNNVASDMQLTIMQSHEGTIEAVRESMDLSDIEIESIVSYAAFHTEGEAWE